MQQYNVEIAGPEHNLDDIYALADEAGKNTGRQGSLNKDPEFLRNSLDAIMNGDTSQVALFLLMHEGKPIGFLLAACTNTPHILMKGETVAAELIWYVSNDHRGRQAWSLVDAFETWAQDQGAKYTVMAHLEDKIGESLDKIYRSQGYVPVERTYLREIS